ncbi:hypothetical protein H920_18046 [Fukomys damarensis]|uniref:Uncharacterized protein n=1 Tax=Fukomys damarensis TaxID=885580 RepID=A0A091DCQ1_FUKDA|nr:hypothetical protein H920_18046 [Fukomys damarensis]
MGKPLASLEGHYPIDPSPSSSDDSSRSSSRDSRSIMMIATVTKVVMLEVSVGVNKAALVVHTATVMVGATVGATGAEVAPAVVIAMVTEAPL